MSALRACVLMLLVLGLWLGLSALARESRLQLAIEGARYQYEPATVRLRVSVERHPANRALTVALVSDGFERSSLEQIDGMDSPRTRWVNYRDVPAGNYAVIAILHRPPDRPLRVEDTLTVIGRF